MRPVCMLLLALASAPVALSQTPMKYDSAVVRSMTGNYQVAADRIISIGPFDEADGWLAFFDSKTHRAGILFAQNDTVLYTNDSVRVVVRHGGLQWDEAGSSGFARRLNDIRQENVSFYSEGVRLAGTITVPAKARRQPAVVLIHGCCGTIPTRDFGYWSAYLAHHGFAVLAFDRRGGGQSGGDFLTASYSDLANDVLAGVALLASRPDIDARRIGLYGMSNGGYVAPLAAARAPGRIAFVAVRSGSARVVGGNIDYEVGNDLRSAGFDEQSVATAVSLRRRVTDFVIDRPTISVAAWDSLKRDVESYQKEKWFAMSRTAWVPRISPADSAGAAFIDALRRQWAFDPLPYWKQVRTPVYIMLGALDRSVPAAESAAAFRALFDEAGNRSARVRVFPTGNHGLLQASNGFDREARTLRYFEPEFQSGLVAWMRQVIR
jgi:dienelactone hydrolase